MVFFYKDYKYAPTMTLLSLGVEIVGFIALIAGIALIMQLEVLKIIIGVLLVALAVYIYFDIYKKKIPAKAEEIGRKNIETKVSFALIYCQSNPDAFEEIAAVNTKFAEKYEKNENGKIVKKKK